MLSNQGLPIHPVGCDPSEREQLSERDKRKMVLNPTRCLRPHEKTRYARWALPYKDRTEVPTLSSLSHGITLPPALFSVPNTHGNSNTFLCSREPALLPLFSNGSP